MQVATEILINARQVTPHQLGGSYEFILNSQLYITECIKLESKQKFSERPIQNAEVLLKGMLFELNHVRVDPKLDNTQIIECLTNALGQIGVKVFNQPHRSSMALCFKPLGEISDNVRFYLNPNGKLIFLSPAMRPKLAYSRP